MSLFEITYYFPNVFNNFYTFLYAIAIVLMILPEKMCYLLRLYRVIVNNCQNINDFISVGLLNGIFQYDIERFYNLTSQLVGTIDLDIS